MLRIQLLGTPLVTLNGQPITELMISPTLMSLLAFLAMHRGQNQARAVLAGLFWPAKTEDQARNNLNTHLWRLRNVLSCDLNLAEDADHAITYLSCNKTCVQFNANVPIWLDVTCFEQPSLPELRLANGELQVDSAPILRTLSLYAGHFMEGHYADWCLPHRERLRERYLNLLELLVKAHQAAGRFAEVVQICRQLLQADALREDAHFWLIQAYIALNRRSEARSQYITYENLWRGEFGLQASLRMQMTRRQLWEMNDHRTRASISASNTGDHHKTVAATPEPPSIEAVASPTLKALKAIGTAVHTTDEICELRHCLWQRLAQDAYQLGFALMQQAAYQEAKAYFELGLDAQRFLPASANQQRQQQDLVSARADCMNWL